jgi:hypothetical protein
MYALGRKWQVVQHQAHVQRLILQAISRSSMRSMASLEELPLYRGVRYGSNRIQALSPTMASHNAEAPCKSSLLHVLLRARHRIRAPALFFLITDGWIWVTNICSLWEGAG